MGNWVRVRYPTHRRVYVDGEELGYTNAKQFVGEPATHVFDLGEPADYTPARIECPVEGTSRRRPLEIVFEPLEG